MTPAVTMILTVSRTHSLARRACIARVEHWLSLRRRLLDDTDFFVAEAVELVDQPVNPPVRRVDLTLTG